MKKIYNELVDMLKKKNSIYDHIYITLDTKKTQINMTIKVLYLDIYPDGVEIADDSCEISIDNNNWEYNEDENGYFSTNENGTLAIYINNPADHI